MDADKFPDISVDALVAELTDQSKVLSGGDMARMEEFLTAQVHTLDALFHRLTRQAMFNVGHHSEAVERYMKLALRAQSQSRAAVETLHEMKYPKAVAFVQQANIAHGPQQVINGTTLARVEEIPIAQNELLEKLHGERLDGCTARAPAAANTELETVGEVHWATNSGR